MNFFQVETSVVTVPTEAMRRGDFSELLNPNNGFFTGARTIIDPLTGQPFPGNIIPPNRLSPNGLAILNAYPLPTPGFRQGTANVIQTSANPQDQRKDNIRLDYRLNTTNQFTYRFSRYNVRRGWTPSAATFPFARTDWSIGRTSRTTASWTSTITNNLINELTYTYSRDDVFIDVFTEDGASTSAAARASTTRTSSRSKEIDDKIPTITDRRLPRPSTAVRIRRRRPGRSTPSRTSTTMVRGRHTFKAGVIVEYSGEDDFDQINVSAIPGGTNNQNGRFEFTDGRAGGTGLGDRQRRAGRCSATTPSSASATSPSGARSRPTCSSRIRGSRRSNLTIEGGFRWVYWPPWYSTTNNIANFDPRFYDANNAGGDRPRRPGRLISGPRYNGVVLPGDGFEGDAQRPRRRQQPGGAGAVPRRAARLLGDARQRLRAAPRHLATRSTRRRSSAPAAASSTTASR